MDVANGSVQFLRNFDWALACPEKPWTSANYHGVFLQEEMWVTVTARDHSEEQISP